MSIKEAQLDLNTQSSQRNNWKMGGKEVDFMQTSFTTGSLKITFQVKIEFIRVIQ